MTALHHEAVARPQAMQHGVGSEHGTVVHLHTDALATSDAIGHCDDKGEVQIGRRSPRSLNWRF